MNIIETMVNLENNERESITCDASFEDTAPTKKGTIIRTKSFSPTPAEIDLYGNIQLHHSVSHTAPDVSKVKKLLMEFPGGAEAQNQFGRIPLHYVLDRATTSLPVVKLLVMSFPDGACVEDNEGNTPYDLALHWHHSKKILRLLLKCDKALDIDMWRRLEYGYLYKIFNCFFTHGIKSTAPGDESTIFDEGDSHEKHISS